jgi:hypothetical protein
MPVQNNVGVSLIYGAEGTFGTPATAAGTSQIIRRVTSSLNTARASFASNEVRTDQQVSDMRLGTMGVSGTIEGELSTSTYDDFLQAALRGTWAAGITSTAGAGGVTSLALAGSTITMVGASFITLGYKVGDIITLSGTNAAGAGSANLLVRFRVTAVNALTMVVAGTFATVTAQTTLFTITVVGSKLVPSTTKRAFTIEQSYPDLDVSEMFSGCRIGGMGIRAQPNGMVMASFGIEGRKGEMLASASSPYFTSTTAQTTTGLLSAVTGFVRAGGADQAVVTGIDLNLSNNLSATPVIGSIYVPDIFYGRQVITGSFSAYMESEAMVNNFLNETEIDLTAMMQGLASPVDFLSVSMQRIKLTGAQKQVGPEGGLIVNFPFQAVLRPGGAGTVYDQAALVIQRSN